MKRILTLLFLALAIAGCKKEKAQQNTPEQEPSVPIIADNLIGYWACESMTSTTNDVYEFPALSIHFLSDYGFRMIMASVVYDYYWSLIGDKLILLKDSEPHETRINSLDLKHMDWTTTNGNRCRLTNMTNILPGKWKCEKSGHATYFIDIDSSGSSIWLEEGATETMIITWDMGISTQGRIVIMFDNVLYTLSKFTDDSLDLLDSSNAHVSFTRHSA